MLLTSKGSLELAFYTVQITLYRGILRSVLSKFSKSDPFFAHLRQRGKEAASFVLKLLEELSVARSSAFWWSSKSTLLVSILLILQD